MEKSNRDYSNGEITVHWKPSTCIHATICFRELRKVFRPSKRPWVNMDGATTQEIIDIVDKCPTDALTWHWNKDLPEEQRTKIQQKDTPKVEVDEKDEKTEIKIMKDGPIIVNGDFITTDEKGREYAKMKMLSFCRCGQSNNMPFCDGTHRKIEFED